MLYNMSYGDDLRVDQIVRYTDSHGNEADAVIDVIDGDSVLIKVIRPGTALVRYVRVDRSTLVIPR